jgi:hypothetical protein
VQPLDIDITKEIELNLKNWIESQVDEVDPELYITAYLPGLPQAVFHTFVIDGYKRQEDEEIIGYSSTAIYAERMFKQVITEYLDKFPKVKRLHWRKYPSITLEGNSLYEIYARLLVTINA